MFHAQARGVERLAGEIDRPQILRTEHIPLLPHQRVTAQTRLDPDLVALARNEPNLD